ncbi:glycosyltransferase family 4 protein [Micromonospora sp. NPDC049559]|uniref:glycosyltransferase family 4 protein n=1 Tax=Micromonospora sp. NPDC049559 TaxID=3155923 RepID=UPI003446769E
MVVPPWYELPPPGYGGLEQVCAALVDALVERGHEVTLFGAGASTGTSARFVPTEAELQAHRLGQALPELAHLARVNRLISPEVFDLVHDHTTTGPLVAPLRPVPTVATVHGRPKGELGDILREVDPSVGLVAISAAQRRLHPELRWAATVHHGIRWDGLPHKSTPGTGPVLWLARFSADKGPDLAIRSCRAAGLPLVLAGKLDDPLEKRYFAEVVEPMLGPDVRVVRNPDRETCLELLLAARSMVLPIRWEEPFGMVMLEAMATGTPVVALDRGAVPELIRSGVTGVVCRDPAELPDALRQAAVLDPGDCVTHVRTRFSAERMAEGYEALYRDFAVSAAPEPVRAGLAPATARH